MDAQTRVREFCEEHDVEGRPEFQLLDLASEVGELAKDACESTDWGASPDEIDVADDEFGDVLFSLVTVAESLDVDLDDALDEALAKYERRIDETGDASSGA
ncbi:MazG-like family protein [Halobium palmae]|uniref:MazG-like family protein n=1 Tax=Halobium palmae TaxID=1776492 RepID=A0ABD5S387_9EURY